jgi:ABC-type uncharacterized transport system permease subunit
MHTIYIALSAIFYLLATFLPLRLRTPISAIVVLGWLMHALALSGEIDSHGTLRIGFAVMLSVALWISVAAYWLENRNFALDSLRVLVLPCAAVASVLPLIFPGETMQLEQISPLFSWHIAIAVMAYSSLTIAAFHAVLMALQETRLHARPGAPAGWFSAAIDRLPALMTMERLLFRMIAFGFVLLTLTVLSGVIFSEQLFGRAFRLDHKTIFTMMSWILFGALLAGRQWRGWRGKTALSFTLSGFAALFLGYIVSRFVFEVVLHRAFV